jgi:hypothetical protein
MGVVLRKKISSNPQGSTFVGTFSNYTTLTTQFPTATFGDIAVVENSQGTAWLPWTLGGTYYPQGTYYWDGSKWDSNLELISEELQEVNNKISNDFVIVYKIENLPNQVGGGITLAAHTTYFFVNDIDLNGNRLIGSQDSVILGASSENCSITSTGLSVSEFLLYSDYTIPIRHITFKDVTKAVGINISNLGAQPIALDWTGVNFSNNSVNLECGEIDNFIFDKGAVLGGGTFIFTNEVGTIGINNSIFVGNGSAETLIDITSTAVITRRFRIIYSSIVAFGSTIGVNVDVSATISTESYILDTINFSGGSTYINGVDDSSNKALFVNCVGIKNVSANGQLYMQNNATITPIALTSTFYKVLGTTTPSVDNSKFSHSNNRLTCDAAVSRKYLIQCSVSFNTSNGNVCEFGFYDSQLSAVRTPSRILATANAAGRAESVTFFCVVSMILGDYLEVHCANTTGANDITITDMNFTITDIK